MKPLIHNPSWSLFSDPFFTEFFDVLNEKVSFPYDISSKHDTVYIDIPLAGYSKNDINLSLEDDILTLQVNEINKDNTIFYLHNGIKKSSLRLSWNIYNLDNNTIKSTFKNGLLRISIEKKKKEDTKKTIQIQ